MYDVSDTIAAISGGAAGGLRHIVRLSGPAAFAAASEVFKPPLNAGNTGIITGTAVLEDLVFDASAYVFSGGRSYTGQDTAELHIDCPKCVGEEILAKLCGYDGVRLANAGEFTLRAYLEGKLDLAQAEAVAQIISAGNAFQIQAAQRLLAGRLTEKVHSLRMQILELLSLLEAGLDFSEEDISFVTQSQAAKRVLDITAGIDSLLSSNVKYERMIGLPSVTIAGCPNAGKSSLLNALLGQQRTIVSPLRATTRDVITEVLDFKTSACVISDCAGIIENDAADEIDEISQRAAIEAVNASDIVIFCVDACGKHFESELGLFKMIKPEIIAVATKSDRLSAAEMETRLSILRQKFGYSFTPLCTGNAAMVEDLRKTLEQKITAIKALCGEDVVAVNSRHYQSLSCALQAVRCGLEEILNGSDELAAMYLRQAYQTLSGVGGQQSVDECILDRIFSNFCIGK